MRILLSSFGSSGDMKPFVAIAVALQEAGHEVVCVFDPAWCERAAEQGLRARAFSTAWNPQEIANRPEWTDPRRGSIRMLRDLVIPRTPDLVRVCREVALDLRPDAVVGHHISFGLPWVAGEMDVPWIMCATAPAAWPSVDDPSLYPGMPDRESYPRWTIRLGTLLAGISIDRAMDPPINAIRRELGLPRQKHTMMRAQFSQSHNLGLWSQAYRPPVSDDPPGARIVGFPVEPPSNRPLDERIEFALQEARASQQPVAVWSLGTTAVHAGGDRCERFIHIAQAQGVSPIILAGTEDASRDIRDRYGVCAVAYAPHETLFRRADFVVHHAGIGTTAAAIRAGVPSILLPFTHDQPDNARRLRRLGVGVSISPKQQASRHFDAVLSEALRAVRERTVVERSARLQAVVNEEDWKAQAVSAITAAP